LPAAVSAKTDPDDMDTTGDDHALDALRYGAMSRPAPTRIAGVSGLPPKGSAGALMRQAIDDARKAVA
jgi:hypothetical protein